MRVIEKQRTGRTVSAPSVTESEQCGIKQSGMTSQRRQGRGWLLPGVNVSAVLTPSETFLSMLLQSLLWGVVVFSCWFFLLFWQCFDLSPSNSPAKLIRSWFSIVLDFRVVSYQESHILPLKVVLRAVDTCYCSPLLLGIGEANSP